jgi:hypothetical protein
VLRTRATLFFALIGFVPAAHAQQGRGTIVGKVTDASGASIKGAKVSILNVDTNNPVNTETNTDGFFNSPPLIVGHYQITVEQTGFKRDIRSGINLEVDQRAEINFQLQIGAVGESVQVTAEAALVNTENASIDQVIETSLLIYPQPRNAAFVAAGPNVHSNAGPVPAVSPIAKPASATEH